MGKFSSLGEVSPSPPIRTFRKVPNLQTKAKPLSTAPASTVAFSARAATVLILRSYRYNGLQYPAVNWKEYNPMAPSFSERMGLVQTKTLQLNSRH
jgi:hypothetical protein